MEQMHGKRAIVLVWVVVAVLFLGYDIPAFSDCAAPGDVMWDVVQNCGEPSWVQVGEQRAQGQYFAPNHITDGWYTQGPIITAIPMEVEQWVYNYGHTRFVRIFTFQNGVLTSIDHGGYGY